MGPPRRRKTRMGYCARTVTDVQPDIVLALGGWMSRMLQSERPDPALSEPEHRAREEKVVAGQTPVTEDSDGQDLRTDFKKKS